MQRRTFLQSMAAAFATFGSGMQLGYTAGNRVRHELFTTGMCARFDLRYPFQQEQTLYSTDSRILIAEPRHTDIAENCEKLPPVNDLWWHEFDYGGWKKLPTQRLVRDPRDQMCHLCYGTGRTGFFSRCGTCHGDEDNWGMMDSGIIGCPDCHFGWVGGSPCTECRVEINRDGEATVGWLPEDSESVEVIDGDRFSGGYMARLRTLPGDIEYRLLHEPVNEHNLHILANVLMFRWGNGGKGFLCGLNNPGGGKL